jgi:cysteine desulfurase
MPEFFVADREMTIYLDCNATTPIEPEIRELMWSYLTEELGNAGSRTHDFGTRAKQAVQHARDQIGALIGASRGEVIFTSGATESNNLAILGLLDHGEKIGRKHIVSTEIEHKAVLEPLEYLSGLGFEVTLVAPRGDGTVDPQALQAALRDDTLLVSVMQVNNETGVVQPLGEILEAIGDHQAYFHTDAAQGFGKSFKDLNHPRLDLISVSGHKIYGPKGVGALIMRKRGFRRPPLRPLFYGGGQERGLRAGTLAVPLIVGLGKAAELAVRDHDRRASQCQAFREEVLTSFAEVAHDINGAPDLMLPHVVNLSIKGLDSEAVMLALKDLVAISNGSACTSKSYEQSHVLRAMGLSEERVAGGIRISWCHLTEPVNWEEVIARIKILLGS